MPLTKRQHEARAEALREAADHLLLTWTDDPIEIQQGLILSKELRKRSDRELEYSDTLPELPADKAEKL